MYEYIKGKIVEITPTFAVIENEGIGFFINIPLTTYTALSGSSMATLYIHQVIREDAHLLFGFFSKPERELFRQLISVSGIGANTARMMLSASGVDELRDAIASGNTTLLSNIKGIGAKTAQRVIIDLKDKVGKIEGTPGFLPAQDNLSRSEALSALVMLGFQKNAVEKVLDKLLGKNANANVEELVKQGLKML